MCASTGEGPALSSVRDDPGPESGMSIQAAFFATAIFASAFLIFLVQPMVGKRILPWFGGVPSVWAVCLAFYQSVLFLGYAYAHLLIRFVPTAGQIAVHGAMVALAIASLPVLPDEPPAADFGGDPTAMVLRILAASVALPFLVLASTGPLVQAWFARAYPTRSPYALYAVSNAGSLLALFAFPFVLEPLLTLSTTGRIWSYAFGATALGVLACSLVRGEARGVAAAAPADAAIGGALETRPSTLVGLHWILLAGAAVVLLMGTTNELCLDVASIPFLWILPLATYLVTFILCFASERLYRRPVYFTIAALAWVFLQTLDPMVPIARQVVVYCALLFALCMILHGELYRLRPSPRFLTAFYLCVSAGGALGGLFVGLAAPIVFDDYYEFQTGVVLAAALALALLARDPGRFVARLGRGARLGLALSVALAFAVYVGWTATQDRAGRLHRERSFFGVLVVRNEPKGMGGQRTLTNGTTVHGSQFRNRGARHLPTAYYGRGTGLGLALTSRPLDGESRIGVIGLGIGTLAAYGRKGDAIRFYEIDPVVVRLARDAGYFSFLGDTAADVEIVVGDARRSMADERARGTRQDFDFLVLDAFSSDAIPVHLLTREAFELYFAALSENGLMAVHVSNRHFNLMSVVSKIAAALGGHSLQIKTRSSPEVQSSLSDWVIIGRDAAALTRLSVRIHKRHRGLRLAPDSILMRRGSDVDLSLFPLWTDDYSDLLGVLRDKL